MKFAILGNSGSGKSTLAARLAQEHGLAHLDLDTVAWESGQVAVARDQEAARGDVRRFCSENAAWVVEGCYASLVETALAFGPELVWLDLDVDTCVANCRARPFEPHKFASREEQDRHLEFLIAWVRGYGERDGELGRREHASLFEAYQGPKRVLRTREA